MTSVDGHPAVELFYQFKNDNSVIFQKQTVILLADHPGGQKMVCYIGTCPGEFSDYYHNQYQEIIRSIKFHKPAQTNPKVMLAADSQGPFLRLIVRVKFSVSLKTFRNFMDIFRFSGRKRVNICFMKKGKPLSIAPVPDSQPLRYALWTTSSDKSHHLLSQLSVCRQVSGSDQLNTPDRIRGYLMALRAE